MLYRASFTTVLSLCAAWLFSCAMTPEGPVKARYASAIGPVGDWRVCQRKG